MAAYRQLNAVKRGLRSQRAFTLVELLTVMLILGILVAVAAPSFLGASSQADTSVAKQYLATAYRVGKTTLLGQVVYPPLGTNQDSSGASTLVGALRASEPQLRIVTDAVAQGQPTQVQVQLPYPSVSAYINQVRSGTVYCLESIESAAVAQANNTTAGMHWAQGTGAFACRGLPVPVTAGGFEPLLVTAPQITGIPNVGTVLSASAGSWNNAPTSYTYQWQACDPAGQNCSPIVGAASPTYTPGVADAGNTLAVTVTAVNAAGSATVQSQSSPVVQGGSVTYPQGVEALGAFTANNNVTMSGAIQSNGAIRFVNAQSFSAGTTITSLAGQPAPQASGCTNPNCTLRQQATPFTATITPFAAAFAAAPAANQNSTLTWVDGGCQALASPVNTRAELNASNTVGASRCPVTFSSGTYYFCNVTLSNGAYFAVAPGASVTVLIDSPYRPGSTCPAGDGNFNAVNNFSFSNPNSSPSSLQLVMYGKPGDTANPTQTKFSMSNSAMMVGDIYAPNSDFTALNNFSLTGSVVSNRFTSNNTLTLVGK